MIASPWRRVCAGEVLLATFLLLGGCGGVLQVTKRSNAPGAVSTADPPSGSNKARSGETVEQLPGIPFYAVGYRCVHTSVWLQPVYRVTVVVLQTDGKPVTSMTKFFGRKEFNDVGTQAILGEIRAVSQITSILDYNDVISSFRNLRGINPVEFDTKKIPNEKSDEHAEVLLAGRERLGS